MNNLINLKASQKALITSLLFVLIGLIMFCSIKPQLQTALPLVIFYITITINTYFSIKLFAHITPRGLLVQDVLDIILLVLYTGLACSFNNPFSFFFFALLLFIVACMKYTFLLTIINHPKLLKRKILVDLSVVLGCTLALYGIFNQYELASTWGLTIIFVVCNLLVFFVWPLYRLDE